MGVDEVITLDDGKEYVLLLSTNVDGEKYFLASEVVDNAPTTSYELFKELIIDNEFSVEQVVDEKLEEKLIEDFEAQVEAMEDTNEGQE